MLIAIIAILFQLTIPFLLQKWEKQSNVNTSEWIDILTDILEHESKSDDPDVKVLQALATAFSIESWKNLPLCWNNFVKLSDRINLSESLGLTRMLMIVTLLSCDSNRANRVDLNAMARIVSRLLERFHKSEYRFREEEMTAAIYKDFMLFLCFLSAPRASKYLAKTTIPDENIFDLIDIILEVEGYPKVVNFKVTVVCLLFFYFYCIFIANIAFSLQILHVYCKIFN